MKQRVISSLVGLVILGIVFALFNTLVFNAVMGAICIIAVIELLRAAGCDKFPLLKSLSIILAAIIPLVREGYIKSHIFFVIFAVVIAHFVNLIKNHDKINFEQVSMAFFISLVVPCLFSCAIYLRDDFGVAAGGFYLLHALGSAWLCDTGAYFVGIKLGKRKLAPVVSPKKTVEGAIGGIVVGTFFMTLLALGYSAVANVMDVNIHINYLLLVVLTPLFNIAGMLGDLSASVIKRHFGVKDYGKIMPGHGGVMDRFDSVMFTLPSVYIIMQYLPTVTVL